jgi:uncharacterized protein
MNMLKTLFAVLALSFSLNSLAVTDDEQVEFSDGLTEGKMKVVQKFVKADKAIVNEKFFGWAPLQMASNKGQMEVVKYLLAQGADINYIHPVAYHTAFHLAALNGHLELAKFLASKGADVNIKLKADVSLVRYFRDAGSPEMVKAMTDLGVKDDGCLEGKCFE